MSSVGNIILPETINNQTKLNPIFQGKLRSSNKALPFKETKNRIFSEFHQKDFNVHRAEALRDQDICGKNYDIVTHKAVNCGESKIGLRENKILAHYSQTSLEGHRNLQGAVTCYY